MKTPQEKALELCQSFGNTTLFAEDCNDGYTLPLRVAKLCALIAVDEILSIKSVYHDYTLSDYWEDVKQEIEKL